MKTRKKRPPQTGELIGVRFQPSPLGAIDQWRRKHQDLPSRAEAIRRLVDLALSRSDSDRPTSKAKAEKAAELAAHAIEKATDKSQSAVEQQTRKRKLIRGPSEFRDIRRDQPKRKG
jgi:hypothetical protein